MFKEDLSMPLYFRGDKRSHSKIFERGFTKEDCKNAESSMLIERVPPALIKDGISQVDAVPTKVISISTRFESAAIFPLSVKPEFYSPSLIGVKRAPADKSYVYVLDLPMPKDELPKDKDEVFDLHSMQASLAKQNIDKLESKNATQAELKNRIIESTLLFLYSYELFALSVSPENILAAVKISRSASMILNKEEDSVRHFCIEKVIYNQKYSKVSACLEEFKEFINKYDSTITYSTTDPLYGLGGKTLPAPKTGCLDPGFNAMEFRKARSKISFFKAPDTQVSKNKKKRVKSNNQYSYKLP